MDINQNDNNELQKAIDDITNNNGSAAPMAANELEAQIQSQMGVPPVPPTPPVTTAPVMPDATAVPTVPVDANNLGVVQDVEQQPAVVPDMAAVVPEAPVAEPVPPIPETTANEEAPTINPEPAADVAMEEPVVSAPVEPADALEKVDSVRGAIAKDLYGLLDVVDAGAEEKFKVVKEMIEETGDKSMIVKGYDIAKGITDEKMKAEALMFLFENA